MKTRILKAGLCLFVITASLIGRSAGQPVATNAPAATNGIGPRIQFDSLNYEFGTVRTGTKVKHDYVFTNTGDATLVITSIQPGCHCTTVGDWTHQVEPGKTGVIPIQFDSTSFGGPIVRSPMVACNDKTKPMVTLQLHGMVKNPVDVSSSYVFLSIGPDVSEYASSVIHITNNENEPLLLSQPVSSLPAFAVELKTNTLGKSYDLLVKTVPPLALGNNQANITLGSLSNDIPPIKITALAYVQPLVESTPSEIAVPVGPLTSNVTINVALQNKGSHPVDLSEPSVNAAGASATVSASQPGKVFMASVEFAPGFAMPAGKPLELSIKTDNPNRPVVRIPIRQAAAPAAPSH
jgi:hypothetical protein